MLGSASRAANSLGGSAEKLLAILYPFAVQLRALQRLQDLGE